MNAKYIHGLLKEVQADYVAMVYELNKHKRRIRPVDPWRMPLVRIIQDALNQLALEIKPDNEDSGH